MSAITMLLMMFGSAYFIVGREAVDKKIEKALPVTADSTDTLVKTAPPELLVGEQIDWQVISSGGVKATSDNHILNGTLAQTAVGDAYSASFRLYHGFWQFLREDTGGCCVANRGNVNGDHSDDVNAADLTYLVDYLFKGGSPPPCYDEGDINGNGKINISDLIYLINYLFKGGPAPLPCP